MCYKMPFPPNFEGQPFSCKYLPIIKNLNLLDFKNNTNINISLNAPQIITAFSSTYFIKGLNMVCNFFSVFFCFLLF